MRRLWFWLLRKLLPPWAQPEEIDDAQMREAEIARRRAELELRKTRRQWKDVERAHDEYEQAHGEFTVWLDQAIETLEAPPPPQQQPSGRQAKK